MMLVLQLIIAAFIVLWIKSWVMKTWAWSVFKKSTIMGLGSKVTATVNGTFTVTGVVKQANKGRVMIQAGDKRVYLPTVEFVKQAWTIHDPEN